MKEVVFSTVVMTMRLEHYFSFIYLSPFSFPIYCTMDTLPSLLVMPCGLCPSPLLSITHLTLTLTVPPTHASVPADVHLSCPSDARLSSLLPYVSLHRLCMLNWNHMCQIAVHSGHWLIAAALVEHRNPLKGSSMIYTHLR